MRPLLRTTALLVLATAPVLRAQDDDKPKPTPPATVPVLVREHKGTPVIDLQPSAFTIKFDGVVQPITDVAKGAATPITYGLVIDVGNGQRHSIEDVRKSAREFISALRPGDKMFVVQFAKDIELLQAPTSEKPKLERAIAELGTSSPTFHATEPNEDTVDSEGRKVHHGGTSLNDAIFLSSDEVLAKEPGKHVLVVFSDGVDIGSKESAGDMLETVMRNHVVIFGLYSRNENAMQQEHQQRGNSPRTGNGGGNNRGSGFPFPGSGGGYPGSYPGGGGGNNPNGGSGTPTQQPGSTPSHRPTVDGEGALKKLSEETGGRMFGAGKHGDALAEGFTSVAADMQSMYWLTFTPQGKATRQGVHPFDIQVAGANKNEKVDIQTSDDFYVP